MTSDAITPFELAVPDGELADLRARLSRTRWPDAVDDVPGEGWAAGVPLRYLQHLVEWWRTSYDWRKHEARLNELPQSETTIDGARVHFFHVRSPEPDALPLILTHGWPGSIVEFVDLVGPLTDPAAHGGDPSTAFHVVVPSIPGFGLSGPVGGGWDIPRVARAWGALMDRLGYERYGAHGGDLGALISPELGRLAPDRVVGVHVNAASFGFGPFGPPGDIDPATLTVAERERLDLFARFQAEEFGFFAVQSTRPRTLASALTDSPAGQLAWIVEKFKAWSDPMVELPEDAVGIDHLLTNVTLHWLTRTSGSSARFYYENTRRGAWMPAGCSPVPTGVALFPGDVAIRRYAEEANNVVHWSEFDRGGHFAALEAPDLLVDDLRAFFRLVGATAAA